METVTNAATTAATVATTAATSAATAVGSLLGYTDPTQQSGKEPGTGETTTGAGTATEPFDPANKEENVHPSAISPSAAANTETKAAAGTSEVPDVLPPATTLPSAAAHTTPTSALADKTTEPKSVDSTATGAASTDPAATSSATKTPGSPGTPAAGLEFTTNTTSVTGGSPKVGDDKTNGTSTTAKAQEKKVKFMDKLKAKLKKMKH